MESASASAVPLGASTLRLWCFSTISMSKPAFASTPAASFNSFNIRLMPKDMLADFKIATCFAASSTLDSCASDRPVVHSTQGIFFSTQ